MKISVIGCGYLGAVHAAAMAELGHEVVGVDVDPTKIEALSGARAPFFEPGFEELLARTLGTGRLRFSTDMAAAAGCAVHFGPPPAGPTAPWAAEPADGCRP